MLSGTDGGSIVVADAGARVLRLIGRSGHDFLWLNDSLATGRGDVQPYAFGWKNLGGDRTWIAPEADLFWSDPDDVAGTYRVPVEFDPGDFVIEATASGVSLSSVFELENRRLGGRDRLSLTKHIAPVPNPFHHARNAADCLAAEYIGYRHTATLSLLSDPRPNRRMGMWHIAQVRAPGEILIPVSHGDAVVDYSRPADGRSCAVAEPGLVRFTVGGTFTQKIGVKADALVGRMGFLRRCGDGLWSLIVRAFSVDPSAEYVDAPWNDSGDLGYAVQCYNDDGKLGDFGELEYHSPAIGHDTGLTSYTDSGNLWAFRAEESIIRLIASRLPAVRI